jgi:hypothetical protein
MSTPLKVAMRPCCSKWGDYFTWKLEALANFGAYASSNAGVTSCQSKIIDLTEKEDVDTIGGGSVDIAFVGGRTKAKVVKDARDVFFPQVSGFRVALEGVLNGQHMFAVDAIAKRGLVPFGTGIINSNECGNGGCPGMGKVILGVVSK